MARNLMISILIKTDIVKASGEYIGSIDELVIDPYSGIVRSILLKTSANELIKLPWSALRFDKSRQIFLLTDIGETIIDRENHSL